MNNRPDAFIVMIQNAKFYIKSLFCVPSANKYISIPLLAAAQWTFQEPRTIQPILPST